MLFYIPLHIAIQSIEGEWQSYSTVTYKLDVVKIFHTVICVHIENQEFACTFKNPRYTPADFPLWFLHTWFPFVNQLNEGKEDVVHLTYNGRLLNGTVIYDQFQGTYIFDGHKRLDVPSQTFEASLFQLEGIEGPMMITRHMLYGAGMYCFESH